MARRLLLFVVLLMAIAAVAVGVDWYIAVPKDQAARFVGRETCAQCHTQQVHDWTGSQHHRAMDLANEETVLGDFDDATLTYQGVTSKMFRRDGKFFIHTEGPDGELADFEVKYVIGVEPLQQYMVEFEDGRVQVLRVTWDTEGRRWFYHYPPDVRDEKLEPDDPLHWTKSMSNWNHMCADCHTTDLKKYYDVAGDQYHTSFAEMNVSCETCHGPGSIHVELAESNSLFWDRNHGYGLAKLKGEQSKTEIESCAKCHMRRDQQLAEGYLAGGELCDHFGVAVLREPLYHADGQINDEVYVYGSFLQSKMHAKGIRCSDCHDPHTAKLKHSGNQVCTSCHQHPAQKYDTPAHHHHKAGSSGAQCVECHMPEKHYMVVDPRRDHSLRVPRPDLSVDLRTPNACSSCHVQMELDAELKDGELEQGKIDGLRYADLLAEAQAKPGTERNRIEKMDRWAAEHVAKWFPRKKKERRPHFAYALSAARAGDPKAKDALLELLGRENEPPIVRATALHELAQFPDVAEYAAFKSLDDKSPLVRFKALALLLRVPESESPDARLGRIKTLAHLLEDPVRLVRVEAARVLAPYVADMNEQQRASFDVAAKELETSLNTASDRPGSHRELASLYEYLGDRSAADAEVDVALKLARTDLEKTDIRFRKVMLLLGRRDYAAAEKELLEMLTDDERNRDVMGVLVTLYVDTQRFDEAMGILEKWYKHFPDDPVLPRILQNLEYAKKRAAQR